MTKIKVSDGKEKKVKKITVTDAPSVHASVQKSTTLSRRYVKKPVAKKVTVEKPVAKKVTVEKPVAKKVTVEKVEAKPIPVEKTEAKPVAINKTETKPVAVVKPAPKKVAAKKIEVKKSLAKKSEARKAEKAARLARIEAARAAKRAEKIAKKDRAIKSAATVISKMAQEPEQKSTPKMEKNFKKKNKAGRVFLALLCSAGTVAALVAFVHFSIPDLSVRVAAIQTGIDAAYPTFVPRGYSLGDVISDKEGVVTMTFKNSEGDSFTLSEEKSTWDSTALLNNYVKKNYPNDFTTLREQGITIYVRGEKASWVNGGLLYKIDASGKYLTKEQIRNIATSL